MSQSGFEFSPGRNAARILRLAGGGRYAGWLDGPAANKPAGSSRGQSGEILATTACRCRVAAVFG